MGNDGPSSFGYLKAVRQAVENLHLRHNSPVSDWVTISIGGVTVTPRPDENYETYLKLADTMLYDAKRFGRNQVVWAGDAGTQWREKPDHAQ